MTVWMLAALGLLVALVPCGWVCMRAPALHRLVALQLATIITALLLVVLARMYQRSVYFDLGVVLAALAYPGGLVFIRFLEQRV